MTLPATARRAGPYASNGVTTAFGFTFKVFDEADLRVVQNDGGVETDAVLNSDYTVSLNADQEASPGGTINYSTAPDGPTITIVGALDYDQPTQLPDGGAYRAQTNMNALDRLAMLIQQIRELFNRAIKFPVSDSDDLVTTLPTAVQRAGKALVFDAQGNVDVSANIAAEAAAAEASRLAIDSRIYPGTYSDDPSTRPDGSAVQDGDRYFNSTDDNERIYRSGVWVNFEAAAAAASAAAGTAQGLAEDAQEAAETAQGITETARDATLTAKAQAESARDAAIIQAGVYVDEPTGRAAVADGQAFKVQGSGDVAAYEYRRTSSAASTLIATYPSKALAEAGQTNALAARRLIVGEITALSIATSGTATITVGEGRVYKEANSGNHEKVIAPLAGASVPINYGIVVDLDGGAIDGSGRVVPTVVLVASLAQKGWQSGNKYLLAVNTGTVVHGLYRNSVAQINALAARKLIAGRITAASWASSTVTVDISEGRSYKENNAGVHEKTIAPLTGQALASGECLVVDLTNGAVDGSGRYIPTKLLIAQGSASGWQSGDKYILAANAGNFTLTGEYVHDADAGVTAGWAQDEIVVVQRADEVDIYMKGSNPTSSKYLRYRMQRKPDATINSDVWRWNEVWEDERTAEFTFTPGTKVSTNGEIETAIAQQGKADFVGGVAHGDEELFSATMLIDGCQVALGGTGSFRCRRVEFLQGSTLYEEGTAKANTLAKAYKRWVFEGGEVDRLEHLVWESSVTLQDCYLAMLPWMRLNTGAQISDKGYRSPLFQEEDVSASGFTMTYDKASIVKLSGPLGYSAEVEALEGWDKPNREVNISNSASYNKIYFDFTGAGYVTTVGEKMTARVRYRLDTKN